VIFKICGIKDISTILCCEKNNVNFFGLIFFQKSPRNVSIEIAIKLTNFAQKLRIRPIGVFVNKNIEEIKNIISILNLSYIQLHGEEDEHYITDLKKNFRLKIIKKISISVEKDIDKIKNFSGVDYFLFDYKPKINELPGGNAKKFDWSLLTDIKLGKPWFLSGGINETNINTIKNYINPNGIDLSSGVEEAPGIKNNIKINSLFKKYYEK